jgi:hypothetical protein
LREAGLVSERRNGTKRLYRARPEGLAELVGFLEEFWDDRLEALKREAQREERAKHRTMTETLVEREIAIAASPDTVWQFGCDGRRGGVRGMGLPSAVRRREARRLRAGGAQLRRRPGTAVAAPS